LAYFPDFSTRGDGGAGRDAGVALDGFSLRPAGARSDAGIRRLDQGNALAGPAERPANWLNAAVRGLHTPPHAGFGAA